MDGLLFLSDFPQVYIITDPGAQRSVREFRMAHCSLGGVHGSLFALDFVTTLSCFYRSSTWCLWEETGAEECHFHFIVS